MPRSTGRPGSTTPSSTRTPGSTKPEFSEEIRFDRAQFNGEQVRFERATFSQNAWFVGARFSGYAWFVDARFSGYTRFVGARFSGDARFDGAQFSEVWFVLAQNVPGEPPPGSTQAGGTAHPPRLPRSVQSGWPDCTGSSARPRKTLRAHRELTSRDAGSVGSGAGKRV